MDERRAFSVVAWTPAPALPPLQAAAGPTARNESYQPLLRERLLRASKPFWKTAARQERIRLAERSRAGNAKTSCVVAQKANLCFLGGGEGKECVFPIVMGLDGSFLSLAARDQENSGLWPALQMEPPAAPSPGQLGRRVALPPRDAEWLQV